MNNFLLKANQTIMTFTLFTNNLIRSIYHNIIHIYYIENISFYERLYFIFLSFISVVSYSRGVNQNFNFRNINKKDYIIYDKYDYSLSKDKNIVVIPTLIKSLGDKNKLLNAVKTILINDNVIIIIVDDGSPNINITNYINFNNVIIVKHFENYGPGAARNTGIEVALDNFDVKFISFIDTDCQVDSDWLTIHENNQMKSGGVYCGQTIGLNNDIVSRYHDNMGTLNGRRIDKGLLYGPSCNMSISRAILNDFRFDERFPNASFEDVEFCVRLIKNNIVPQYIKEAIIFHDYDNNIKGFYNQFYRYGKSHPLMLQIHPEYHEWYSASEEIPVG